MIMSEATIDSIKSGASVRHGTSVEDEADVFEITDFTTASEWERFIARLEEILHEWKLVNHEPRPPAMKHLFTNGIWAEKSEEVVFADFKFILSYLYLRSSDDASPSNSTAKKEDSEEVDEEHKTPTVFLDLMNFENDFPPRAHYLCRWYGLQELFTLIPADERLTIESESRARLLLSSASVAFSNSSCSVPVFIQIQQKWRKLFTGTSIVRGASIEFEMSHLRRIPPQHCHLAGLLEVFKSKLGCVYISMPPVSVAVRFTYVLQDWIYGAWPQLPPDFSSFGDGEVGYGDIDLLPFGACKDPISELHLSCTWPCLSEDMIVENSLYSDLDPLQAPQWIARLQMTDDPQCLLGEILQDFLKLCERQESTEEVLRKVIALGETDKDKQAGEISHVLMKLTEPVPALSSIPSIGNVVNSASSRIKLKPEDAPIPEQVLDKILYYLFPDAKVAKSSSNLALEKDKGSDGSSKSTQTSSVSETAAEEESQESEKEEAIAEKIQEMMKILNKQLKSAPMDSLTHKLGLALCNVNRNFGGLLGVAHLWQELILEMRFRWENKFLLNGIEKGPPNMGSCLLHQKLQMLNCCIECKIKRETAGFGYGPDSVSIHDQSFDSSPPEDLDTLDSGPASERTVPKGLSLNSSSDDDEFFECADDDNGNEEVENNDDTTNDEAVNEEEECNETYDGAVGVDVNAGTSEQDQSCADSLNDPEKPKSKTNKKKKKEQVDIDSQFKDSLTHRPEGRMVPMKNVFLLSNGEQLYIPVTQEPSPMTEDMLEEHAEVLAKLGSSAEGSQIRARMQSACLVSDMESFKAANPGCLLEDFVRWYSPRDYEVDNVDEDENPEVEKELQKSEGGGDATTNSVSSSKHGRLSQRMQIPGNMWVEAWQSAKAVPARRQKRLFDDTKEAEKVLHYLSSMRPAEVVLHLMPCIIHAAIARTVEEAVKSSVPNMKTMMDQIVSRATKVTRNFPLDKKKYSDLLRLLEIAETVCARTNSLRSKFSPDAASPETEGKEEEIESFVTSLLTQSEIPVRGGACGPAGAIIHKMFIAAQKSNHMILDDEEDEEQNSPVSAKSERRGSSRKNSAFSLPSPTQESRVQANSSSFSDFPPASSREYILRAMVPRPAPYSKVLPQRMYCLLTDGDNRLAGAFTSDSTFQ